MTTYTPNPQRFRQLYLSLDVDLTKIKTNSYFPLLTSVMYFSKAIVIEGVAGVGARISTLKP